MSDAEQMTGAELCTWCGEPVERGDGFRVYEPAGARQASFCRLEHIVPWVITGARWEAATEVASGPSPLPAAPAKGCSQCGAELGAVFILAVRHRAEHRIPDAFCTVEHLGAWAKAGGRWG